ncbi:MAG: hypothetical protein P8X66_16300 [Maritimibacter sp.]
MISPPPHEPRTENQWGLKIADRLVEIGAVLLGNLVNYGRIKPRPVFRSDGIHIAQHQFRHQSQCQRRPGPAIASHQIRGHFQQFGNSLRAQRPSAEQRYIRLKACKMLCHLLNCFRFGTCSHSRREKTPQISRFCESSRNETW